MILEVGTTWEVVYCGFTNGIGQHNGPRFGTRKVLQIDGKWMLVQHELHERGRRRVRPVAWQMIRSIDKDIAKAVWHRENGECPDCRRGMWGKTRV